MSTVIPVSYNVYVIAYLVFSFAISAYWAIHTKLCHQTCLYGLLLVISGDMKVLNRYFVGLFIVLRLSEKVCQVTRI